MPTFSITVTGKVQGVFYRQSTREKANALGITGEVRNLPNGNVHIVATGQLGSLQELVQWCKQGPPKARVEQVVIEQLDSEEFKGFKILR